MLTADAKAGDSTCDVATLASEVHTPARDAENSEQAAGTAAAQPMAQPCTAQPAAALWQAAVDARTLGASGTTGADCGCIVVAVGRVVCWGRNRPLLPPPPEPEPEPAAEVAVPGGAAACAAAPLQPEPAPRCRKERNAAGQQRLRDAKLMRTGIHAELDALTCALHNHIDVRGGAQPTCTDASTLHRIRGAGVAECVCHLHRAPCSRALHHVAAVQ